MEIKFQGGTPSFCNYLDDLQNIKAKKIAECAKSGKEDALKVYDICGRVLGKGFSMVVDLLNSERISPDLREFIQGALPAISLCSHVGEDCDCNNQST